MGYQAPPRVRMYRPALMKLELSTITNSVALGEMSQARDLLALLLSMSGSTPSGPTVQSLTAGSSNLPVAEPSPSLTPGLLTASTVTPLPSISSVQAFDAELIAGGKDDALRKASEVLHVAADGVERSMSRTDSFWADALRIRRANCTLVPAPLPIGAPTGKGADKTSKDFLISFGLSQCMDTPFQMPTLH